MKSQNVGDRESEKALVQAALRDFKVELHKFYEEILPVIRLYGSQARGDATPDSDIDLLLLYRRAVNPGQEIQRLAPLLAELNLRYGVLISLLPATEREYRESEEMFWVNVRREGIPIEAL